MQPLTILLGGQDLEMAEVAALVRRVQADEIAAGLAEPARTALIDRQLGWGAKASDCRDETGAALAHGRRAALIELTDDLTPAWPDAWPQEWRTRLIFIDHHGPRAGAQMPSSLRQAFALLGCPQDWWTRRLALVEANDIGHIAAMQVLHPPASLAEMRAIRAEDRAAQGVSAAEERDAEDALRAREEAPGLTVLSLRFDRATAAADIMEAALGGPGFVNLLVRMPSKLGFFGKGEIVSALAAAVPGSWWGGALPVRGYWGMASSGQARLQAERRVRRLCAAPGDGPRGLG